MAGAEIPKMANQVVQMIKMRLQGVEKDIKRMVDSLKEHYNLLEVSAPYKNRGESQFVRVYVSLDIPK